MPPDLDLTQGYSLRVTALDTSGNLVAGVNVGKTVITVNNLLGGNLSSGPFLLVAGPGA
jgi:hypothetical protein